MSRYDRGQGKAKDHVGDGRSKGRLSSEHEVIDSVFSEAGWPVNSQDLPVSAPAPNIGGYCYAQVGLLFL